MIPEIVGGAPSTVIALVDTTIGNIVPSRRTPVVSTSRRCTASIAHLLIPLEELLERIVPIRSHDRRDREPDDLRRVPAEHRFGRGIERTDRPVGQ